MLGRGGVIAGVAVLLFEWPDSGKEERSTRTTIMSMKPPDRADLLGSDRGLYIT
jgi:gas vesicle protein